MEAYKQLFQSKHRQLQDRLEKSQRDYLESSQRPCVTDRSYTSKGNNQKKQIFQVTNNPVNSQSLYQQSPASKLQVTPNQQKYIQIDEFGSQNQRQDQQRNVYSSNSNHRLFSDQSLESNNTQFQQYQQSNQNGQSYSEILNKLQNKIDVLKQVQGSIEIEKQNLQQRVEEEQSLGKQKLDHDIQKIKFKEIKLKDEFSKLAQDNLKLKSMIGQNKNKLNILSELEGYQQRKRENKGLKKNEAVADSENSSKYQQNEYGLEGVEEDQIEKLKSELKNQEIDFIRQKNEEKRGLEEQVKNLSEQLKVKNLDNKELQKRLQKMEKELEDLNKHVQELTRILKNKEELQEQQYRNKKDAWEQQNMEESQNERENEIFEIKKQIILLKQSHSFEIEELEQRNGNLIKLNKNLEKEKKSIEKDFKKMQKEFEKLLKEIKNNYQKLFHGLEENETQNSELFSDNKISYLNRKQTGDLIQKNNYDFSKFQTQLQQTPPSPEKNNLFQNHNFMKTSTQTTSRNKQSPYEQKQQQFKENDFYDIQQQQQISQKNSYQEIPHFYQNSTAKNSRSKDNNYKIEFITGDFDLVKQAIFECEQELNKLNTQYDDLAQKAKREQNSQQKSEFRKELIDITEKIRKCMERFHELKKKEINFTK